MINNTLTQAIPPNAIPPSALPGLTNPVITGNLGNTLLQSPVAMLQLLLQNLISIAFGIAGVYAFFMLLRGGYEFITAGGDKEGVANARKRIMNALVGLALIFSIFAIISVFEILFNLSITRFNIPQP